MRVTSLFVRQCFALIACTELFVSVKNRRVNVVTRLKFECQVEFEAIVSEYAFFFSFFFSGFFSGALNTVLNLAFDFVTRRDFSHDCFLRTAHGAIGCAILSQEHRRS